MFYNEKEFEELIKAKWDEAYEWLKAYEAQQAKEAEQKRIDEINALANNWLTLY